MIAFGGPQTIFGTLGPQNGCFRGSSNHFRYFPATIFGTLGPQNGCLRGFSNRFRCFKAVAFGSPQTIFGTVGTQNGCLRGSSNHFGYFRAPKCFCFWVSQTSFVRTSFACFREEEPDEGAAGMKSIDSFMLRPKKKKRANYFAERALELVDTF